MGLLDSTSTRLVGAREREEGRREGWSEIHKRQGEFKSHSNFKRCEVKIIKIGSLVVASTTYYRVDESQDFGKFKHGEKEVF